MTRADVAIGGVLAILFGAMAWQATSLTYGTEFAPGPGFTPVWLGAIGAVLGTLLLAQGRAAAAAPPSDLRREASVTLTVLGVVVAAVAAPAIGLVLALAAFLLFFTLAVERLRVPVALATSFGTALFIYLVFERFLNVPFPVGPLGF